MTNAEALIERSTNIMLETGRALQDRRALIAEMQRISDEWRQVKMANRQAIEAVHADRALRQA